MSATDPAKEVVRIAGTAGLSEDVIDLMDKKISLLANENAELTAILFGERDSPAFADTFKILSRSPSQPCGKSYDKEMGQ